MAEYDAKEREKYGGAKAPLPVSPDQLPDQLAKSKSFTSRDEVERRIMLDLGRWVALEGEWKDERRVFVPRWMAYDLLKNSETIAFLISELFPNDLFFLYSINMDDVATATARIHEILFGRVYPQMYNIICATLQIDDDERGLLERRITPRDLLEIFCVIMEDNIVNQNLKAITKKIQAVLGEKFNLESVFPNISDIMGERYTAPSESTPTSNSSSYGNTGISTKKNNG